MTADVREPIDGSSELRRIFASDGWRVGVAAIGVAVTLLAPKGLPALLAGCLVAVVTGYPILRHAIESLMALRMTMELSMSIAIGAALAIGETSTALLILLFVLVAEILEELNLSRGRRAMTDLAAFLPRTAFVEKDGASRRSTSPISRPATSSSPSPAGASLSTVSSCAARPSSIRPRLQANRCPPKRGPATGSSRELSIRPDRWSSTSKQSDAIRHSAGS